MLQFVMSRADISWLQVALKTLIVIHRLLREGDGTFKEDFLTYSYRGNVLQIPQFKDDSSPLGAHSSCIFRAWVQKWRPSLCMFCSTYFQCLNKQVLCSHRFCMQCSLGLLRLGSHVRALPGRAARVLQDPQVRRRTRSAAQVTPCFWQGR